MKTIPLKKSLLLLLVCHIGTGTLFCQGTFENLDFSSTTVPPSTPAETLVPASEALPGWTVYLGGVQQGSVLYNSLYTGQAVVAFEGPGFSFGTIIPGSTYMPVLQAGLNNSGDVSASIAQTGTVPGSAQAILFTASQPYAAGWSVTLGGQNLSVVPLGPAGSFYEYYGANIPSFAGQTETLEFTAQAGSGASVNMYLDNIQFSIQAVPEPESWAMILCGAAAFAASRWKRKKASC